MVFVDVTAASGAPNHLGSLRTAARVDTPVVSTGVTYAVWARAAAKRKKKSDLEFKIIIARFNKQLS